VSQLAFRLRPRRKKPFNLHRFILNSKVIAVEILTAIAFLTWIFRAFLHEILGH